MENDIDITMRPVDGAGMMAAADVKMPPAGNSAPQNADRTMRINDAHKTSSVVPPMDITLRPAAGQMLQGEQAMKNARTFVLKGDTYEQVNTLSESSGEAQVFLVRKRGEEEEYVLKVYYPNFDINKKLLQVVRSFEFEMIVKLFDYGKTYVDGKHRYYELMEYLPGGTLRDFHLEGDFNRFRRIALQAAAALAYCHHRGVLHKDIKPTNFFFRDLQKKQLVLGDFGISALHEADAPSFHTTQARTPMYAAPEMYIDVIDGVVEITEAADYYSLGMTLFALWLGENPMSSNERVMMKQKNEGRLPRLNELPERVKQLVQGLTAVNQQSRWGYEQVERWFQGENVPVDLSSPFLRYKSFVVDPDRNIIADNVHELVPLLADNENLAINYLYNGRLMTWLENSGNTKLSELLKDIVNNRYPVDKKAGLACALYTMDPTYPYIDIKGEACDDVHSVSLSLLSHQDKYALLLQRPSDALFLWLESHSKCDVDRLRSYFAADSDPHVAVLRLVYEIDPDMPFLARHPSSTIQEITHSFGFGNPTDDDWIALTDGRLLSWMYCHEDLMACESLRILTQGQPYSRQLAYKVLYNLDREAAFDLRDAHTPEGIGEQLSHQLMQAEHFSAEEFENIMKDYTDPEGRFYSYAQLHGWFDLMTEATRCFDLTLPENKDRLSAYDLRTALYRFCRILGANPSYLLSNGTILSDGRSMDLSYTSLIRQELRQGTLAQWMAVYYHEDPTRDFSEEYSYERELQEWIMALGRLDSQQAYYRRFTKACEDTKARISQVRQEWHRARAKEKMWKYIFYGLSAVWVLLVLIIGISGREYLMAHKLLAIGLPVGGMSAIIVSVRAYFKGMGPTLACMCGALGALTAFIPIYVMEAVQSGKPQLLNLVVVALTAVYVAVCHFTAFRDDKTADADTLKNLLSDDDVKTSLLEPLYYTFKTKSNRYKSTKFGVLNEVSDQVRSLSGESVIHYVLWSAMMLILVLEFCIFSSHLFDAKLPMN